MNLLQGYWKPKIEKLLAEGELGKAAAFLMECRESELDPTEREHLTARLVLLLVHQSRYKEAFEISLKYEAELRARKPYYFLTLILAYVFCLINRLKLIQIEQLLVRFAKYFYRFDSPAPHDWGRSQALLWGVYWQNINSALHYNVMCLLYARTEDERLRSVGFLGYTLAFKGHSSLGLPLLRRSIDEARKAGAQAILKEMYVFLGVALQMSSKVSECFSVHSKFEQEIPDAPAFSRIISHASRCNVAFSELGPIEASKEADLCFTASFALKESRNQIQIYGVKATLLALEGRASEALIYLHRSRAAARTNDNTLDHLIFHRFESVVYYTLGRVEESRFALILAQDFLRRYGAPTWYVLEIARIDLLHTLSRNPKLIKRIYPCIKFWLYSAATLNLDRIKKANRISRQVIFDQDCQYWSGNGCRAYLRSRLSTDSDSTATNKKLERVTLNVTEAMLRNRLFLNPVSPTFDDLLHTIQLAFPDGELIAGDSLTDCLQQLREKTGILPSTIFDDHENELRVSCDNDLYFVAVACRPTQEAPERYAVGVLIRDLDISSQNVVEAGLQVLLNTYTTLKSIWISRQEHFNNQQKIAIANMASQVAHDVQSPLAALEMMAVSLQSLPEDKRTIVRSAVNRIRDISNDLRERNGSSDKATEPAVKNLHLIPALLESIVTEKRLQFRAKLGIHIDLVLDATGYGLFAEVSSSEFKRAVSNIVNNSVESITGSGRVDVTITGTSSEVTIRVEDSGIGIPSGILPRLGTRGRSFGKVGGQGLGLAHARSFAGASGGRLEIASESGTGTVVSIVVKRSPAPGWFLDELIIPIGSTVIVLDDDTSIHQIWKRRFEASFASDAGIQLIHFSTPDEVKSFVQTDKNSVSDCVFMLDYELMGHSVNGLSIAEDLGIKGQTLLVTSRYEELSVRSQCERLGVKLLPKGLVGFVPLKLSNDYERPEFDALLIDDDELVHLTWRMSAPKYGKKVRTFRSVAEFDSVKAMFNLNTPVYIDANLGDGCSGELVAANLSSLGFQKLYLATGYPSSKFGPMSFLSGIVGKAPPWLVNESSADDP